MTIFGSSQIKASESEYLKVVRLGKLLARAGFTVCNGGYGGLMEASARGAKEAGGKTIGVTTEEFKGSRANPWVEREKKMKTWRDRLFQLIDLADGYVVCEGETGTLVELSCVWEMSRKGLMPRKPIVLFSPTWKKIVDLLTVSPTSGKPASLNYAESAEEAVAFLKKEILSKGSHLFLK